MKEKKCPLCYKPIYSELGKSCRLCGMTLSDESKDFCSKECRLTYKRINSSFNYTSIGV